MRLLRKVWGLTALGAALQVVCPLAAQAADMTAMVRPNVQPPLAIRDVELDAAGTLRGQLLTPEGAPLVDASVSISRFNKLEGQATTDQEGRFAVTGQRGGTFELRGGSAVTWVRLWTHDSAPPAATKAALLVADKQTVRGNINYMSNQLMQSNEAVGALMIPAAIAGGAVILKQHHEQDSGS